MVCHTCDVSAANRSSLHISTSLFALITCAVVALCGGGATTASAGASTPARPDGAAASASLTALTAPKTSSAQEARYFSDVTQADRTLDTYAQKGGNTALRALLTDGTAFCALLKHSQGIDEALVAEAEGVRSTESKTNLPLSVTTFNTIEAVSLLTLCPSEQHLLPASERSRIQRLGNALAGHGG